MAEAVLRITRLIHGNARSKTYFYQPINSISVFLILNRLNEIQFVINFNQSYNKRHPCFMLILMQLNAFVFQSCDQCKRLFTNFLIDSQVGNFSKLAINFISSFQNSQYR